MDALPAPCFPQSTLSDALRAELDPRLDALRSFLDRRIAELSAELHATTELQDMGETRLSGEISRIQEQIAQLVAKPSAATRNSGLELESVVEATEAAANTILEAAEAIQDWMARGRDPDVLPVIMQRVNAIFEACAFQDLTGQRIRRAIQHLQELETTLQTVQPASVAVLRTPRVEVATQRRTVAAPKTSSDLAQSEIDALLNW